MKPTAPREIDPRELKLDLFWLFDGVLCFDDAHEIIKDEYFLKLVSEFIEKNSPTWEEKSYYNMNDLRLAVGYALKTIITERSLTI